MEIPSGTPGTSRFVGLSTVVLAGQRFRARTGLGIALLGLMAVGCTASLGDAGSPGKGAGAPGPPAGAAGATAPGGGTGAAAAAGTASSTGTSPSNPGGGTGTVGATSGSAGTSGASLQQPAAALVPTARLARLSRPQWVNTVKDLLGLADISDVEANVSGDAVVGFDNDVDSLFVGETLRSDLAD